MRAIASFSILSQPFLCVFAVIYRCVQLLHKVLNSLTACNSPRSIHSRHNIRFDMQNFALVSLVVLLIAQLVDGQQRWYYTGKFQNDEVATPFFEGLQYKQSELYDPNHTHLLYFGGTVARAEALNVTNHEADVLMLLGLRNGSTIAVHNGRNYPLVMSRNYAAYMDILNNRSNDAFESLQYQAEVGLYDHRIREFLERYWRDLQVGELTAVEITIDQSAHHTSSVGSRIDDSVPVLVAMDVSASGETAVSSAQDVPPLIVDLSAQVEQPVVEAVTTGAAVESKNDAPKQVHRLLYTSDIMGRASIYAHTWNNTATQDDAKLEEKKDLRVMSFNLWHNNPPSWVYHNPRDRWDRYSKRLSHFADVVVASDPDIIALQEVRLDSSFLTPHAGHTLPHWQDLGLHKPDAGNQAEHVLSYLAQARVRAAAAQAAKNVAGDVPSAGTQETAEPSTPVLPYYQFVFQPAMSLIDSQRLQFRNEEGVMILSKYPIEDYQVILLPRAMNESSDDHQRVILKVKVRLPSAFVYRSADSAQSADVGDTVTVDVMTSHFSLSEVARNRGVRALVQGLSNSDTAPNLSTGSGGAYVNSPIQILTGDFNAEPHEDALQYLLDADNFATSLSTSAATEGESTVTQAGAPFVDAYTHIKRQNIGTNEEAAESDPLHVKEGFTFPACNPVKRIDFIMVRNHTHAAAPAAEARTSAHIVAFRIEGTRPSADTEHLVGSREGLGMNDRDSPLWASDHFAVVADLRIVQSRV